MQHIQYLKSTYENGCCLEWIFVFRQAFFCHYRHFIIFQGLSPCRPWKTREKKERVQGWAGGNGAFDFLFTLGTIETEMREDL